MEPYLKNGSEVLVSAIPFLLFQPTIGDIVLFSKNGKKFIKRISKIKANRYFLLGDNNHDSMDSREIGWVDKNDIIGKVIKKL